MKMDFSVAWGRELATYEIADHSIAAEEAGFDMLGIIDTQNLARDPYPAMTIAALNTNRVRIGPSVTNTFTRHPSVTANAMATIDEISGGQGLDRPRLGFQRRPHHGCRRPANDSPRKCHQLHPHLHLRP